MVLIDNQQIKTRGAQSVVFRSLTALILTDCSQLSETYWIVITQLRPALHDLSALSS